jgi:hypothetical protein
MKELLIALFFSSPQPVKQEKKPCETDFSLLKPETQVKLGMACSTVNRTHVVWSIRKRKEILESDKEI